MRAGHQTVDVISIDNQIPASGTILKCGTSEDRSLVSLMQENVTENVTQQEPDSKEYERTLERLESHEKSDDFATLCQELTEEKLKFFEDCPEELLPRLFKMAHATVEHSIEKSKESFEELPLVHPVYGAMICCFFQSGKKRALSIEIEIDFFHTAGDLYAEYRHFGLAIVFYHRIYKKYHSQFADAVKNNLKNKLTQLEWHIYHHFLLALEQDSPSINLDFTTLQARVGCLLNLADGLAWASFNERSRTDFEGFSADFKEALDTCYQAVVITRYFEALELKLRRSLGEEQDVSGIMDQVDTVLLPLAERINSHVAVNKNLIYRLNECYQLIYNVIRDEGLELPLLHLQLEQHKNSLFEQRENFKSSQDSIKSPLFKPLWFDAFRWLYHPPVKVEELLAPVLLTPRDPLAYFLWLHTFHAKDVANKIGQQLKILLGEPPRGFVLVNFGSSVRDEMLPNSDIDLCLLVDVDEKGKKDEKDEKNENDQENFKELLALKNAPYFKYFLQAFNHLLKLCYGGWICIKNNRQRAAELPTYLNRETQYRIMPSGLRIDAMELEDIASIIHSPSTLADCVASCCTDFSEHFTHKDRVMAYGLLTPQLLYSSYELFDPQLLDPICEVGKSLLDRYLIQLHRCLYKIYSEHTQAGSQTASQKRSHYFPYFIEEMKQEYSRLYQQWQRRKKWRSDEAFLFIKSCLFVLDVWSLVMVFHFSKEKELFNITSLEQRFMTLQQQGVVAYYLEGARQCRLALLKMKYSLDQQNASLDPATWKPLQLYLIHVILPAAYQLAHYEQFTAIEWIDPYSEFLKHAFEKPSKALLSKLKDLPDSAEWLSRHHAQLEDFKRIYALLLNGDALILSEVFINALPSNVAQILMQIPNSVGYRQSERFLCEKLFTALHKITQETENELDEKSPKVTLTWYDRQGKRHQRFLSSDVTATAIDASTSHIKKCYQNSFHAVAPILWRDQALHIKQLPGQPLTDYAIDILARRLIGSGTPANTLARLTIKFHHGSCSYEHMYPVLISETIAGKLLKTKLETHPELEVENASYTGLVLLALLTCPGDGVSRNFVVDAQGKITFIDLDQHFVEPVIKQWSLKGFNKVQFCSILFALQQANHPLDRATLQAFCELKNITGLINQWVAEVVRVQKQYLQLFDEAEQRKLYSTHKDEKFTVLLLLREGVLGTLLINLNHLQVHITKVLRENKIVSALDLLNVVHLSLGQYYSQAYRRSAHPEQRLANVTGMPQHSISSRLALQTSLGVVPRFEEIKIEKKFTLESAQKELITLIDFRPDFSKIVDQAGNPDKPRRLAMLKALALSSHKQLSLSHCSVLTDALLREILKRSTELKELNLQACPQLTEASLIYLSRYHKTLCILYFTDNDNLKLVYGGTRFNKRKLYFPSLETFHVSRCVNLIELHVDAPKLKEFKGQGCHRLSGDWEWRNFLDSISQDNISQSVKTFSLDLLDFENNILKLNIFLINDQSEYADPLVPSSYVGYLVKENYFKKHPPLYDNHSDVKYDSMLKCYDQEIETSIVMPYKETSSLHWSANRFSSAYSWFRSPLSRSAICLICGSLDTSRFDEEVRDVKAVTGHYNDKTVQVLIGISSSFNKRVISSDAAVSLARELNMSGYFECSLERGESLIESFQGAVELAIEKLGFWEWKDEKYIPSQCYLANKLLSPDIAVLASLQLWVEKDYFPLNEIKHRAAQKIKEALEIIANREEQKQEEVNQGLFWALNIMHLESVEWLLKQGAVIATDDRINTIGLTTTLHFAIGIAPQFFARVEEQHILSVVKALVFTGADVNALDQGGRGNSVLKYTLDRNYKRIADFLISRGAKISEDESLEKIIYVVQRIHHARILDVKDYKLNDFSEKNWNRFVEAVQEQKIVKLIIHETLNEKRRLQLKTVVENNIRYLQLTENCPGLKYATARLFFKQPQNYSYRESQIAAIIARCPKVEFVPAKEGVEKAIQEQSEFGVRSVGYS